jgi:uncharacterized membrane protein
VLWAVLTASAIAIAFIAIPSLLSGALPLGPDPMPHFVSLLIHAAPGALSLFIGPFQFATRLRVRYPTLHRVSGRVYMMSVVVAAVAAFTSATYSVSGFTTQVAFYILSIAWLYTLFRSFQTIRRGEVQLHRIWMIRNYSLTFAAVTLRIYLFSGIALQQTTFPSLTFADLYATAVWASILGNILVAEYFIVNRTLQPLARRQQRRNSSTTPAQRGGPVGAAQIRS